MKKIFFMFLAVVVIVSFTACNKTSPKAEEAAGPATEVTVTETPVAPEPTPAEALKAFQAYSKEYGEAFNNMIKDPQKFQTLAAQLQQKLADMERVKVDLTPAQIKDYEKALKIITDANSGGTKK